MSESDLPGTFRIIVMDDEPLVLSSVSMLLESLGHEVIQATHGQKVIDLLSGADTAHVDLAIVDLTVRNGLGGLDIVTKVRSVSPQTTLVVSSGFRNDRVMRDHKAAGFDGKLEKPYGLRHLVELIDRMGGVNK